jgi:hypothetical protein
MYALALTQGYQPREPRRTVPQSVVTGVADPLDVVIAA